jgi:BirA family biotin operon repressor/biotin-[acetyl-CoA-carboxylase] ligase
MQLAEREAVLIADVHEIMHERTPTRNLLIGAIVAELLEMLRTFTVQGFAPFKDEWHELDTLANAPVKVISGSQTTLGTARGVDADGTLLVDVDGELRKFVSGEVSLRAVKG